MIHLLSVRRLEERARGSGQSRATKFPHDLLWVLVAHGSVPRGKWPQVSQGSKFCPFQVMRRLCLIKLRSLNQHATVAGLTDQRSGIKSLFLCLEI